MASGFGSSMLGIWDVLFCSTIKLKLVCLLPSLCVSVVITSCCPGGVSSGSVICVCVAVFCPTSIVSGFVAVICPVFVLITVCLSSAVAVFEVGLVIVFTNVSFPPGTTVLTSGVVDIFICFGSGVSSFIATIAIIIRKIIISAVIASVFVLIIFLSVTSFIAWLISWLEYPDCRSLVRIAFSSYPCFIVFFM